MSALDVFLTKAKQGHKLACLTCYDHTSARHLAEVPLDLVLVGDSLGMVIYGDPDTHAVDMTMMQRHTRAVVKGLQGKSLLVADLPRGTYEQPEAALTNAQALIDAGANAVKLEGAGPHLESVRRVVSAGIPVMGHIGLTPQTAERMRVVGRDEQESERLKHEARALQDAGVFALVIEAVPAALGQQLTEQLRIPTIGIGAGAETTGQILVQHDATGDFDAFKPKFVRRFGDQKAAFLQSMQSYIAAVHAGEFPSADESYS